MRAFDDTRPKVLSLSGLHLIKAAQSEQPLMAPLETCGVSSIVDRDFVVAIRSQSVEDVCVRRQRLHAFEMRLCQLQESG